MTRGLYRTLSESGACFVRVEYSVKIGRLPQFVQSMELTEQRYRERKYEPVFDTLPLENVMLPDLLTGGDGG